ncbi:LuxR family transcriptional regulator [Pseudomonas sp. SLFW]|uniref:helix-turn-helix transcriptional regulator n=1 Tax=Pseudomonas sp. SLFW TaxID=2683259 RepID=UPI001412C6EC|nr:LuxR family transcriptional regulator [Pseudomonas sp. SLFW]NBB08435.1 LuxR family transcriptional regulator [Pseudomonas sp. SLFW]
MDNYNASASADKQAEHAATFNTFRGLAKDIHRCDWERLLKKTFRELGFARFLVSLGPARACDNDPLNDVLTTFPKQWLEHYRSNRLIEIDPILKHCHQELVPYFWSTERRRARGRSRQFWELREQHGLRNGLSIPLRYELFRGTLSVAFDDVQAAEQTVFPHPAVSQLFMLVPYLLDGMGHQFQNSMPERQGLTPREMECLYWASAGKTSWEISHILTRSERTIDFHLLNARRKLGSVSRQQAVGAAAAYGLIAPAGGRPCYSRQR